MKRETDPAFFRPETRLLRELTNEELQLIFDHRTAQVKVKHEWGSDNKLIYAGQMIPKLAELYEVMLEIQSRYRKEDVALYQKLLPVGCHNKPYSLEQYNKEQYEDTNLSD